MQATDLHLRVLVLTAIVVVAVVIIVAVRGSGTVVNVEEFARDVQQLTTDASIDLAQLAPAEVERDCVAGDHTACALHSVNATAVADRIDELFETLAALPLPGEARGWVTDYGDALAALRAGWHAQAVALRMDDDAAFDAALVATTEARSLEQRLIQQFERDYTD